MASTRAIDRLVSWSPVLLLGGLAALTYWLDAQIQASAPRDGRARHDPDIIVKDFRAVTLNDKGHPTQKVEAREARHYPDDGVTAFVEPKLEMTQDGRPRFSVTATQGRLSGDRENAYFEGRVKAVRDAEKTANGSTNGPITMTTEYLHVMPREDKAMSDRPVTIQEPRGIIEANGFVLNDRDKTIVMQRGLRGTFEPEALPK